MKIEIEATADSQFGTNSYLVQDMESGDAAVIDANLEPQLMVDLVARRRANVKAILLTHTDVDHIAGLARLREAFADPPVAVHAAELVNVTEAVPLRGRFRFEIPKVPDATALEEGDVYRAGVLEFAVLHTPGHSPGGVTFLIGNALFTGDALFAGSIGRTDFENSDSAALLAAIRDKLMTQPDEYLVLSGHGPVSTIGQERRYNPFL